MVKMHQLFLLFGGKINNYYFLYIPGKNSPHHHLDLSLDCLWEMIYEFMVFLPSVGFCRSFCVYRLDLSVDRDKICAFLP